MKSLLALFAAPALFTAAAAYAQTGQDSAGHIISQPARDVGAEKTEIPPILKQASEDPYATRDTASCAAISSEIAALGAELGEDYGEPAKAKSNREKIAAAGGKAVVNSLIPFRGLVREISGAGPAERRLQAAVQAGVARRGYLRGLQSARRCAA